MICSGTTHLHLLIYKKNRNFQIAVHNPNTMMHARGVFFFYLTRARYVIYRRDALNLTNLARYGRGRCGCASDWNDVDFAPFPLVVVGVLVDGICHIEREQTNQFRIAWSVRLECAFKDWYSMPKTIVEVAYRLKFEGSFYFFILLVVSHLRW